MMGKQIFAALMIVISTLATEALARETSELSLISLGRALPGEHLEGFVDLPDGQSWFIDYRRAHPGQPTVVLFNGMTYSTKDWDEYVGELLRLYPGAGILRMDMEGMGQTLERVGSITEPVNYLRNSENSALIIRNLELDQPAHFVSLSYGFAIATTVGAHHPDLYQTITGMGPYIGPMASQHSLIMSLMKIARKQHADLTDEQLYDRILRFLVYATYPAAENSLLAPYMNPETYWHIASPFFGNIENMWNAWWRQFLGPSNSSSLPFAGSIYASPFNLRIEAAYRKAQGVRKFLAASIVHRLKPRSVFLMQPEKDEYIEQTEYDLAWQYHFPEEQKASRLLMRGVRHKIPQGGFMAGGSPRVAALFTTHILDGNPLLFQGKTFTSDREDIDFAVNCEDQLKAIGR